VARAQSSATHRRRRSPP